MRKNILLTLLIFLVLNNQETIFASEVAVMSSKNLGVLTILPPIIAIFLSFITRNIIVSLLVGAISGSVILSAIDNNIINSVVIAYYDFTVRARNSVADVWGAGVILQILIIGGFVYLISKMGGAKAIAINLSKKAKGAVSTQLITWFLGIIIFFDDFASVLLIGPIMRPLTDKMKISREKLAFILDSTASSIAGIALISTWIGLEITLIASAYDSVGIMPENMNAYSIFIKTIPYRFYNILIVVFVLLTIVFLRDIGSMVKVEKNARKGIINKSFENNSIEDSYEPETNVKLNPWNALVPIILLIVGAFVAIYMNGYLSVIREGDQKLISIFETEPFSFLAITTSVAHTDTPLSLLQAALFATIVTVIMGVSQKIITLAKGIEFITTGMKHVLVTITILILAWSLTSVIKDLGTAVYLGELLGDKIPMFLLPTIIFILGAIISFSTGTAYGTMSILMPLAVPLAVAVQPENYFNLDFVIITTGAVLTSAIFGDHCSPISDTSILSSMGARCELISHVKTQMPYALIVAGVAIVLGYIPAGLGISPFISLSLGIVSLIIILFVFGKKIED